MKTADLAKRVEELERKVAELEARPVYVPYPVPQFVPVPNVIPWQPVLWQPIYSQPYTVTITSAGSPSWNVSGTVRSTSNAMTVES